MLSAEPAFSREWERVNNLAKFDLDYTHLEERLSDLTLLASRVAGTSISLINLIDSHTQRTVASHGLALGSFSREESVCEYTLTGSDYLEVTNLAADSKFQDKVFLTQRPDLRYYLGVPLTSKEGYNVGALCVLDSKITSLAPGQIELLKLIAREIVNHLEAMRTVHALQNQLQQVNQLPKKLMHDVQGPIRSIQELCWMMVQPGNKTTLKAALEALHIIQKTTQSVLDLSEEILNDGKETGEQQAGKIILPLLKEKLEKLYWVKARNKKITFQIDSNPSVNEFSFSNNKLLQITGNLLSNALKFTPVKGTVTVTLDLLREEKQNILYVAVKDSGVGMEEATMKQILENKATSTVGTQGEEGFGLGLPLVASLIQELNGTLKISSRMGVGTTFEVYLPQKC